MKIDSIPGESRKKGHENQIEIISWQFGLHQEASVSHGSGSGAGRVSAQDVVLTKMICKADAALMQHCCSAKHIPEATIFCEKAGGDSRVEYVKIVLKQVIVTTHNVSGAEGGDQVSVQLSLNFAEYEITYTQQSNDGTPGASTTQGWHVAEDRKV
ncbi:MAG: type VI secretion system tube protein Hcp [Phyllobacteriaceae bacterium]|nr:type VI secretion system tube protein Hcp [Phyllobacteriaceae bacterium]